MSTTSLKLPDELQQRAIAAATAAKRRAGFVAEAEAVREEMLKTGKGYDADEVHAYLQARLAGTKPPRPKAKSWQG